MSMATAAPPGTFVPGTKVHVGSHRVMIEKYLSEGGFAHVYVARVPAGDNKHSVAVLKRVAVPDKDALASMRTEVETMKRLQGHKHIVRYIDSHASQLKGGGYEVFLLMEYCDGGGLIDFMNTRLQHRLTEPEILNILGDVSEGVATMHYLKPPLLHRDLKVENVLISKSPTSGRVIYKLCDFGSAAQPRPAATTATEGRLIEEDIQKHTTMQYRSPEMVDVWRRQPIDEKSDIWALGVLLYKLCYYTTPFEDVGQMAILNASFKYPPYPPFSDRIKRLIGWMLREDPQQRPNIYQVIKEVCSMRGTQVPIKDIYTDRTQSEVRRNEKLPSTTPIASPPPAAGISHAPVVPQAQALPDIAPMRRGRPTSTIQKAPATAAASAAAAAASDTNPVASPGRGDPFAALDSSSYEVRAGAVDELAARFPSLDEFSIVHDKPPTFQQSRPAPAAAAATALPSRVGEGLVNDSMTKALADQVFAQPNPASQSKSAGPPRGASARQSEPTTSAKEPVQPKPLLHQPKPLRPGYTSTGTMTSPSPPQVVEYSTPNLPNFSKRPIWRVPESHHRSSSQPRARPAVQAQAEYLQSSGTAGQRPGLLEIHRSKSQTATDTLIRSPTSPPDSLGVDEQPTRARSANSRPRPASAAFLESNLDYLRTQELEAASKKRPSLEVRRSSRSVLGLDGRGGEESTRGSIELDTEYLRSMEDASENRSRKSSRENPPTGHKKRSSLPSLSLSGTRSMLTGKFGDAFKKFERGGGEARVESPSLESRPRTPSPQNTGNGDKLLLSPISGSEATASPQRHYEERDTVGYDTEELPAEVRREMERLKLSAEEKRVADAAAEYRKRTGGGPPTAGTRANTIQQRVQTLLDEGRQPLQPKRTAEGYGPYTDTAQREGVVEQETGQSAVSRKVAPSVPKKGLVTAPSTGGGLSYSKVRPTTPQSAVQASAPTGTTTASGRAVSRPSAPPKPKTLKTGTSGGYGARPSSSSSSQSSSLPSRADATDQRPSLAALLAKDSEGVAAAGAGSDERDMGRPPTATAMSGNNGYSMGVERVEEWEADFSKRYPSLSGIEMVETEISSSGTMRGSRRPLRVREV